MKYLLKNANLTGITKFLMIISQRKIQTKDSILEMY